MHSKVINPNKHGRLIFHNRGSCKSLVTYLGHEAREQQQATQFFSHEKEGVAAEEVRAAIDGNTKGLRRQQEKFYSLVLSPSEAELKHLHNDPGKLRQYTRQVMENYAANFMLQDKNPNAHSKRLSSSELVWFATIHQERKEKQGEQKGASKAGLHQHVHILVSAKDKTGTLRLNPRGHRSRFSIREWQVENGKSFQQMFGYQKPTVSEKLTQGMPLQQQRHEQRIREKVDYLNEYFTGHWKINTDKALTIGKEQQYGRGFFFNLHKLTKQYQEGKAVNNPYHMLETGKDEKISLPEHVLFQAARTSEAVGQEMKEDEPNQRKKQQAKKQMER